MTQKIWDKVFVVVVVVEVTFKRFHKSKEPNGKLPRSNTCWIDILEHKSQQLLEKVHRMEILGYAIITYNTTFTK